MPAPSITLVISRAPAKVNFVLRVLDRRADGYHSLDTRFQSIALFDTIACRHRPGPLAIRCSTPGVPIDDGNLVWRAATGLWRAIGRTGDPRDVEITLTKRIPMQAGLGGGSSDAAAALRCLSLLWQGGMNRDRLHHLAASLGADAPFFLVGGSARGRDRGDALSVEAPQRSRGVLLLVPPFGVSTADAYRWLDDDRARLHSNAHEARAESDQSARDQGLDPVAAPSLVNDLEAPVARRHPEVAALKDALLRAGASDAAMSGSGSTVFGLFKDTPAACRAARGLGGVAARAIVTRTLSRGSYRRLVRLVVRRS